MESHPLESLTLLEWTRISDYHRSSVVPLRQLRGASSGAARASLFAATASCQLPASLQRDAEGGGGAITCLPSEAPTCVRHHMWAFPLLFIISCRHVDWFTFIFRRSHNMRDRQYLSSQLTYLCCPMKESTSIKHERVFVLSSQHPSLCCPFHMNEWILSSQLCALHSLTAPAAAVHAARQPARSGGE